MFAAPMKPVLAIALSGLLSTTAVADEVTLKFAGTVPLDHFGNAILESMADEIEAAGVGLSVKYFPASQLGSGEELLEDAIRGNVDLVHATIYAHKDPRLEIFSLPFLVTTYDELRAFYGDMSSPYNTTMTEIVSQFGIIPLGSIGEGMIGVVATKKPADHAAIGPKEMNIRVWSSRVAKATMEELGFQTTTMNWAEVFPAVQAGTIDGAVCCTAEWAYTTFAVSDVGRYFVPYNAFIESTFIYTNERSWSELNAEQQAVVRAASEKAAAEFIDEAWERNQGFVDKLRAAGWEILDLTPEERAAIRAHIQETVWPEVEEIVGTETMSKLMGTN